MNGVKWENYFMAICVPRRPAGSRGRKTRGARKGLSQKGPRARECIRGREGKAGDGIRTHDVQLGKTA